MNWHWKDALSTAIWRASDRSHALRQRVAHLGMRTRRAAYRDQVVRARFHGGTDVHLTHLDENYLSFQLFWKSWEHFEPLTTALMMELMRDRHHFLDIGANIGYFSLTAAALFPDLSIVAFEPNPKMAHILERNIECNDFGRTIRAERIALSESVGTERFYLPSSDMSGSLVSSFNAAVRQTIDVPTSTLDAYLDVLGAREPTPGEWLIKIDTEGHEPAVLRGARETLERWHPDLIVEITRDYDDACARWLTSLGYRFYPITDTGLEPSERLAVCRRGDFLFLNTLITRRSPAELARRWQRAAERLRGVDLRQTSLYRPDE